MPRLSKSIRDAIKSGPVPDMRDWRKVKKLNRAEKILGFAETHLRVPEGLQQGQPMVLAPFQEAFIRSVFPDPDETDVVINEAIMSVARRNGKSALLAVIMLACLVGPESKQNEVLASAANSRDQAALLFRLMSLMIQQSKELSEMTRVIPSKKSIVCLANGSEYFAMSADAKTGHGRGLSKIVLDEAGQIRGANDEFVSMLRTSQGSVKNPLFATISTQAPSDADYLSRLIDDAVRNSPKNVACHFYHADEGCDLLDKKQWKKANPGLGLFRSEDDLRKNLETAIRIPSEEAQARNLLLNNRISMDALAFAPALWKDCGDDVDFEVFRNSDNVALGLDLSQRNDLTAAVLCAEDEDGITHTLPFVFCPTHGILERSRRDRAPYDAWVKSGDMYAVGGNSMDYDQIADKLALELADLEIDVNRIYYDKYMITQFQAACERVGAFQSAEWEGVQQHFRPMGVRLASFQTMLAEKKVKHGSHPLLNMAAANAVAQVGREGLSALTKSGSSQRIDPAVALIMAAWPFGDGREDTEVDISTWFG